MSAPDPHPARDGRLGLQRLVGSLAGTAPTPAGGAAAAASVAQGIALFLKAVRITGERTEAPDWKTCEDALTTAMAQTLDAFEADCTAFQRVLAARRRADEAAELDAWVEATERPLSVASVATGALATFARVAGRTRPQLKLDQEAAVKLLGVGISISIANARGNLEAIGKAAERERMSERIDRVHEAARGAATPLGLDLS